MALKFKRNDVVRQVVPVIEGVVGDAKIVDGDVQYEVAYVGADGEPHFRFFKEDEIEAVAAAEGE